MSDPLDAELDGLFRQHPNAMVKERNALVDRLRKAGNKEGAAKVKALARPSPSAWALNQVYFDDRELLDDAFARADEVRALHARDGVDVRVLQQAVAAQRAAVSAVVEAASRHIDAAGLPSSPAHQRRLTQTVQAVLSGACSEPLGRLTEDVEPLGFGGVAVVGAPRAASTETQEHPPSALPPATRDASIRDRALEQSRRVLAERGQERQRAKDAAANARRHHDKIVRSLRGVCDRMEEMQKALDALAFEKKLLEQEEAERRATRARMEHAELEAEEALEKAASELARLF